METIAVINQKGGVAKTTTAQAVAAGLTLKGYRVLMIDLDGQQSLTGITATVHPQRANLMEVLTRKAKATDIIVKTGCGDLMPGTEALSTADIVLKETGREYRLKEALKPVSRLYDYCIIDSPPALGVLTVNALTAADACIITAQADILSLQAIKQLAETLKTIRAYTNKGLKVRGVLITRYNGRAVLSRDAVDLIQEQAAAMGATVFDTKIRECIAVKEAQARRKSIFEYAPRSNAAADYMALVDEIARG